MVPSPVLWGSFRRLILLKLSIGIGKLTLYKILSLSLSQE